MDLIEVDRSISKRVCVNWMEFLERTLLQYLKINIILKFIIIL